jgi:hypothetical protein
MSLTVPEPKIDIYEDGFAKHDKLDRVSQGRQLSELVERISEPMVIAVDGAWGSGKSHFLKCWVGEHLKGEHNTEVVYFDAFEHDFLDDPLIALTGVIGERLAGDETASQSALQGLKRAAPALGRGLLRMGVSVATAGVVTRADDLVDAAAGSLEQGAQDAIDSFWKKEDGKRAAMKAFREALVELTEPDDGDKPTRRLIVVVDELDRCRPDYALSLLEIIKHFFNVDGVHFVLGCNMEALAGSVRARYGADYDGERYLSKFISVTLPIGAGDFYRSYQADLSRYFRKVSLETAMIETDKHNLLNGVLKSISSQAGFSLRDVERLCTLAQVTRWPRKENEWTSILYSGLLVMKVLAPEIFRKAKRGHLELADVATFLLIDKYAPDGSLQNRMFHVWWFACGFSDREISQQHGVLIEELRAQFGADARLSDGPRELREILQDSFGSFDVPWG